MSIAFMCITLNVVIPYVYIIGCLMLLSKMYFIFFVNQCQSCRISYLINVKFVVYGSFHVKSTRGGLRHGSDFIHIVLLNTLSHTKTRSEILGPSLTRFGNNGRLNIFPSECPVIGHLFIFLYYDNFIIFIYPN